MVLIDHRVVLLFLVDRFGVGGYGFAVGCLGPYGLRRVLWFVNSLGFLLRIIRLGGIRLRETFVQGIGWWALLLLVVLAPVLLFLIRHRRPHCWNQVGRQYCSCSGLEGLAILI